jgi:hypothetical protein
VAGRIDVAQDGGLSLGQKGKITDSWAYMVDAKGASVYFVIGGSAIARFDMSGTPELKDLIQVMSTPTRMRFGATAAYAPLGYAGLAVLPQ